jgi:hypothetical protein
MWLVQIFMTFDNIGLVAGINLTAKQLARVIEQNHVGHHVTSSGLGYRHRYIYCLGPLYITVKLYGFLNEAAIACRTHVASKAKRS